MKKFWLRLFLCCTLLTQSSCLTQYVWGDKSYEDDIEQFFVAADGRSIALIGTKYHYVFLDKSAMLRNILSLKQKSILTINTKKTHLKLDSNNNISGDFVLEGPASILPREDLRALESWGFKKNDDDLITVKLKLNGRRYAPRYLSQNVAKLNEFYTLQIYYSDSNVVKDVGKVAITPVAVTLDAVILIGKAVVYPFSL